MIAGGKFNRVFVSSSIVVLLLLSLPGCKTLGKKQETMQSALAAGRVGNALAMAEKEDSGEKEVLASLNKGMLRRIKGDYQASNRIFEVAKQQIEDLYGVSVSEQAGALIVNDTLRSYSGDRYEQVLLHAYMAMNYIQQNDLDAARVEMLQANVKMQEWGEQPEEDPFVRYLSGMIFEALGEKDQALVAYRQAMEVYKSTMDKHRLPVPEVLKKDLLRSLASQGFKDELRRLKKAFNMKKFKSSKRKEGFGELIVVLNSSLAPVRKENSIVANTGGEIVDTVKIAVPSYPQSKQRFSARVIAAKNVSADLEVVEDVDALARAALDSDMALITTRAITRAVIKHESQERIKDKSGPLAGFLATVVNVATEQADTRSWTSLPQTIQLTRVMLPKGKHKIDIKIYDATGAQVDTIQKEVNIKSGQSSFLTEHWLAPNMSLKLVANK